MNENYNVTEVWSRLLKQSYALLSDCDTLFKREELAMASLRERIVDLVENIRKTGLADH
jgi:hypothetical protein